MISPLHESTLLSIGPVPISGSMLTSVGITLVLGIGSLIIGRSFRQKQRKQHPKKPQKPQSKESTNIKNEKLSLKSTKTKCT